ncbi:MAG: FAD-dependent oxidoreductase [Acetobacteraceae bacterium]|nr:FAD-dependent oxidoreductase [Acetobacteraceae bacterium]
MKQANVIVIGAGVAGLAAAATLRATGRTVLVLESSNRVGGRAWTVPIAGRPFDLGATWLHDAERNPLAQIARDHGAALVDADAVRARRLLVDGRPATPADHAAYASAADRFEKLALAAAVAGDPALADAVAPMADDPWLATVETWEAAQIAAADARDFSVRDWRDNALDGANLWLVEGIGGFCGRVLAPMAGEIRYNTAVTGVNWGGGVTVSTSTGEFAAASCIVTVSTGVLGAGAIRFDPMLPAAITDAIAGLPMGLLTKVAVEGNWPDRLGIAPGTSLRQRVTARFAPAMSFHCWPNGHDYIAGFVGGPTAWALARAGEDATRDFVRARFAEMLGPDAAGNITRITVSGWGSDQLHRGAYCYARPGRAGARAALGAPLGGGRLIFAGEATRTDGLAGTVGGAWLAGVEAAGLAA